MKTDTQRRRWFLPATAAALLLAGCAGFAPVKDAPHTAYRPPSASRGAAYDGMANGKQIEHLRRATFPALSETERALMIEINRDVNKDITYMSDDDNYGWMDVAVTEPRFRNPVAWGAPSGRYGDCEDYALTKKHRLIEHGMDPSRLFVIKTKVPTAEGDMHHVVLAVPEGSEWWVLNNWDNRIEPASYLKKWWDWDFYWPRFEEYQHLVRARNGQSHDGAGRPGG
jgi:predicted transglutaminase-like cysteine proteinase